MQAPLDGASLTWNNISQSTFFLYSIALQVVVLTSFSSYESDATLAQRGGFALLPQQVRAACASVL